MVAMEAMLNGIPVLASRRGGLPEVVGDGGFLFDIPDRCMVETRAQRLRPKRSSRGSRRSYASGTTMLIMPGGARRPTSAASSGIPIICVRSTASSSIRSLSRLLLLLNRKAVIRSAEFSFRPKAGGRHIFFPTPRVPSFTLRDTVGLSRPTHSPKEMVLIFSIVPVSRRELQLRERGPTAAGASSFLSSLKELDATIATEAAGRRAVGELQQALTRAADVAKIKKSPAGRGRAAVDQESVAEPCPAKPVAEVKLRAERMGGGCSTACLSTAETNRSSCLAPGPRASMNWD